MVVVYVASYDSYMLIYFLNFAFFYDNLIAIRYIYANSVNADCKMSVAANKRYKDVNKQSRSILPLLSP